MNTEASVTRTILRKGGNADKQTSKPLSPAQVIDKLRTRASTDAVFHAVAEVFAMRERTRQQVTLQSLMATMLKEGYKFNKEQYTSVLAFMATLGLGTLERDNKGRIRALKGISITLQSIGLAAVSKKDNLAKNNIGTPFVKLPQEPKPKKEIPAEKVAVVDNNLKKPIRETTLTIKAGYKTFNFELFPESGITALIELVDKVYQEKTKKAGGE